MTSLLQDLRYAVRLLLRTPGFTLLTVLTLALGIGANAAIFSVIDAVLLRPLPYPQPERLVRVFTQFQAMSFDRFWISAPEFLEYRQRSRSFEEIGAFTTGAVNITGREQPVRVTAALATAGLFPVLGVEPQIGRVYTAKEDLPNTEPVVVLSHELWQSAFQGDKGILGRRIQVDAVDRTVIGVMPPGFDVADEKVEAWMPLALDPASPGNRGGHYLYPIGRLKADANLVQARAEVESLLKSWSEETAGQPHAEPRGPPLIVLPMLDDLVGSVRPKMWLLMGAVGFVLLIACANVANLLLARAEARQKEIAVRTALGAARGRLLRQFLTESVVLSLLGGALGLGLAVWGVRAIVATNPDSIPRVSEVGLDARAVLFTLGVSLLTGVLFGLAPALHARAAVMFAALKEGGQRSTAGARRQWLRRTLVVTEVALAAMLVIVGGLLIRSFWLLQQVDPGFDPKGVLSFQIALPDARYPDDPQVVGFYSPSGRPAERAARGRVGRRDLQPAAEAGHHGQRHGIRGRARAAGRGRSTTSTTGSTSPRSIFETLRIPLKQGRRFQSTDSAGTPGVVLVNEQTAKNFWPGQNPIGKRLRAGGDDAPWLTVVGVVGNIKQQGIDADAGTEAYFLHSQMAAAVGGTADDMYVVVRAKQDPLQPDRLGAGAGAGARSHAAAGQVRTPGAGNGRVGGAAALHHAAWRCCSR